jgi:hypothetical protein
MRRFILPVRAVRLACWLCLPLGLLLPAAGCKKTPHAADHVDVSGQVLYNGKPVTGGQVTFVTVEGAFASTGSIDEKGNYTIKAPVGEVKIAVDTEMLNPSNRGAKMEAARKGAGRPDAGDPNPPKGTYVKIPQKYRTADSSELSYTVTRGSQTHNIELTD